MSYAQQQRDPRRHLLGVASVILLHIIVVYALVNGLGRKVVEVFKKPLEVAIVEEVKPEIPPPPPPKTLKPLPKLPPPPAYAPPPEVNVAPPPQPSIAAVSPAPPPPAPPAAPAPEPQRQAAPAVVAVGVACPNHKEVQSRVPYPPQAIRMGLSGEVEVEFTVQPNGSIGEVGVARSSNKIFNAGATAAVTQFRCVGQGQAVRVRVPFVFRLDA